MAGMVLAGAAVFAATNLDDLFLLVAFFADRPFRQRSIVAGQFAGIGVLFAVSLAASMLAQAIPASYVALLGLLPIAIGVKKLREIDRTDDKRLPKKQGALSVAAVTLANGGDNIGVYTPLFATSSAHAIAVMAVVFAAATALWCWAAWWLVSHPSLGAPIRRYGSRAVPVVLIALGLWILLGS